MPIEAFAAQNCSIARPLSVLGERWTILVLREISLGSRRFDEIRSELGVATNVLSARLATLVDEGIVERRRYSEHPERFEYRLTEKGGDLQPILLAFLRWGDTYTAPKAGPPLETVHATCGHVFHMVPTCSHCGEKVRPGDIRPRPGPGASRKQRERAKAGTA
ncbi:MAG: helix-turn-helix domain-containing protein [Solirubrobacterales bacterium]